jgi:hypothetical protein
VKVESLVFLLISFFLFVAAIVYGLWAKEPIGTTALVLSGGLTVLVGGFFWFVSRRIDARPEDRKDADIAEGAGELGFFSPGSYWPFAIGLACFVGGLGVVFFSTWLIALGVIAVLFTVGGLLFEYYTGQ